MVTSLLALSVLVVSAEDAAATPSQVAEAAVEERPQAPAAPPIKIAPAEEPESFEDYRNRQPMPAPGGVPWISAADYPLASWQAGEEGDVGYVLTIADTGEVEACTIDYSTGFDRLDSLTCELLMERAKFYAGVDPDGNAVGGEYSSSFYWEKREPEITKDVIIAVRFTMDENGQQQDCEVLEMSDDLPESMKRSFDRQPCPRSMVGPPGVPYRDENGVPIAKTVTVRVEVGVEDVAD